MGFGFEDLFAVLALQGLRVQGCQLQLLRLHGDKLVELESLGFAHF